MAIQPVPVHTGDSASREAESDSGGSDSNGSAQRDSDAATREAKADTRETAADTREAKADTRDATADTREATADTRQLNADTREAAADSREADADIREAVADAQRQASQYARSLLEASLDPLVMISPEGKITDVNEATVEVTGVTRSMLIGTDFSDYFTEPGEARSIYQQVFAEGSVRDYPLTIHHTDGRQVQVLYNASAYRDERGNVLGVFAAARDVTAQRHAEREIIQQREIIAQRAKELDRLGDLERFQRLTVGRELKMIELKKEIQDLRSRLPSSDDDADA
ncbi:MAG: putative sensor protein [Thermoleophilia bacterium]|nr:putative sensor protein [Thermoleophilia bacterium]